MRLSSILHATERTQPIAGDPPGRVPVVIVGGGPVGLAAALELAWRGVDCLLVEPRRTVSRTRPRAKTTDVRTMEAMRRWGLASELRGACPIPVAWSNSVVFCESLTGTMIAKVDDCFGLATARVEDYAESSQQVPQFIVEDVLRDAVVRNPRIIALFGWSVTDLIEHVDGVTVTLLAEDGRHASIESDYVIGADGGRSLVRDVIGAELVGEGAMRPTYSMVIRAPGLAGLVPHPEALHYWVVNGIAPGNIGRLDLADTWWLGFHGVTQEVGDARSAELVAAMIGREIEYEVFSTDPWVSRSLAADRWSTDRIFLSGDAAHQLPPWGGHGYNTGVGDSIDIAWKLAAVLHGELRPSILTSYETERRAVFEQMRRRSVANLESLADRLERDADELRRRKEPEFRSLPAILGQHLQSGLAIAEHPAAEPIDVAAVEYVPECRPGSRMPHFWLADGTSVFDHLGKGFAILWRAGGPEARSRWTAAVDRLGISVVVLDVGDEPAAATRLSGDVVLARPDGFVAWVGGPDDDPDAVLDPLLAVAAGGHRSDPMHPIPEVHR